MAHSYHIAAIFHGEISQFEVEEGLFFFLLPVRTDASGTSVAAAVQPLDISLNSSCQASKGASRHLAADNVLRIFAGSKCMAMHRYS